MNFNSQWRITKDELKYEKFDFIILDRFQTPQNELEYWKKIAPVIGIDEGGSFRDSFDFLIDMLVPENFIKPSANICSPKLLIKNLTQTSKQQFGGEEEKNKSSCGSYGSWLKILITFGHEDKAGLDVKIAQELLKNKQNEIEITLLKGGLNNSHIPSSPNLKILETIPNLPERLCEYDLVITHYGITAYEALFAGTPVLLAHPTPYHKKLAKAAGFDTFRNAFKLISSEHTRTKGRLHNAGSCGSWLNIKNKTLAELINCFSPQINRLCPACGSEANIRSAARFDDRTYRRCLRCGIIYMDRICPPPVEYEREYFFEQYQKQYGKTYLEDFENIKNAGIQRLKNINLIYSHGNKKSDKPRELSLLDIGCAYGPFLAAARDEGFSPFGIEPAEDAVRYINKELGITAIHSPFPAPCSLLPAPFDVITLWYVIEHFSGISAVLAEIKKILKPGGILAFSTPSFSGISGQASLKNFLSKSPSDHFTVWSPKMCKKALSLSGFKVKKTVISGHHPERFPLLGKFAGSRKSPLFWILLAVSKLFGLGDTFEVYASLY